MRDRYKVTNSNFGECIRFILALSVYEHVYVFFLSLCCLNACGNCGSLNPFLIKYQTEANERVW